MNVLSVQKKRSKEYEQGYALGLKRGIEVAVKVMMFQITQYLGDKRGWNRESVFKALVWLHKHAEMILEDYTTFDEVVEVVAEEYGIVWDDGKMLLLTEEAWRKRYPK